MQVPDYEHEAILLASLASEWNAWTRGHGDTRRSPGSSPEGGGWVCLD